MQIIKSLLKLLVFICPFMATAQSTYLPEGDKGYHFIDRMEIKQQVNTDINFSTIKPYNRKYIVQETEYFDSILRATADSQVDPKNIHPKLTPIDEYNKNSFYMNNSEWVTGSKESFLSKKPFLKSLYVTKTNMFEVNTKDFFLVVNPILQFVVGKESGNANTLYLNTRGINIRGMISKKIGFYSSITDNQESGPSYFQQKVHNFNAVPGVGFYKNFKTNGFDYFDARGYVAVNVAKYIDITFGYDKTFIGNGYRSLFFGADGNSNLFTKINLKIWKLNYQLIYSELTPQFTKTGDTLLDKKYATMHHLDVNVTKWLNIGLFESIIFGRTNSYELSYLNPFIFFRSVEGSLGSPDNAFIGLDFKANVAHHLQFYGQFNLDEFVLSQAKANTGWWGNKWGLQLGAKYVDAFGVPNLDLQLESNSVKPFTYSHYGTGTVVANYTHYNQPIAHPLGANLSELIGIAMYQPAPKWYINARIIYYKQGLDSLDGRNYGSNPFRDYNTRVGDYGYFIGTGRTANCLNASLSLSYEFRENLFFELTAQKRNYKILNESTNNASMITAGIRLNIRKREYDY